VVGSTAEDEVRRSAPQVEGASKSRDLVPAVVAELAATVTRMPNAMPDEYDLHRRTSSTGRRVVSVADSSTDWSTVASGALLHPA